MAERLRIDHARLGEGFDGGGAFWYAAHDCWLDNDLTGKSRLSGVAFLPEYLDDAAVQVRAEGAKVPEQCRFRSKARAWAVCEEANESLASDGWAREEAEAALRAEAKAR